MDFFEKMILGKLLEEELLNEELENRYGKGTLLLKDDINKYVIYSVLQKFFLIGLLILMLLFVFDMDWIALVYTGMPIFYMFSVITLGKVIYIKKSIILTPQKIILQNIFNNKNEIVTYDEINKAVKSKKIEIKNRYIYIPTNKNPIKILILSNMKMEPPLEDIN